MNITRKPAEVEEILVSAPLGHGSAKVLDALPCPPRLTGQEGAIQILLK